jgi:hypothetical protein
MPTFFSIFILMRLRRQLGAMGRGWPVLRRCTPGRSEIIEIRFHGARRSSAWPVEERTSLGEFRWIMDLPTT